MVVLTTISGTVFGLATLATPAPARAAPAPSAAADAAAAAPAVLEARATYLGGVDMMAACQAQYGTGWFAYIPFWPIGDAYSWVCRDSGGLVYRSVDVTAQCKRQYNRNDAYADAQGGGLYDWGCFRP